MRVFLPLFWCAVMFFYGGAVFFGVGFYFYGSGLARALAVCSKGIECAGYGGAVLQLGGGNIALPVAAAAR